MNNTRLTVSTLYFFHFLGIVEMMAAGLIVVAHNSGGPKMDIITPLKDGQPTGFLADTEQTYAQALLDALSMTKSDARNLSNAAR